MKLHVAALKGFCHKMILFLKAFKKADQYFLNECRWFLIFCDALLWRKLNVKFWLASMKHLLIFENPSCVPLQEACSGFLIAACDSKSYLKAAHDPENCSVNRPWMYTGENGPMWGKESQNRILMRL